MGFEASASQRRRVAGIPCLVCMNPTNGVDPAHLIDRSLTTVGQDDPRAVVPLCRRDHRLYDEGAISLLELLEPRYRVELAFAVERVGLMATLQRVTNDRYWSPKREAA